jgi:hypothetical protein
MSFTTFSAGTFVVTGFFIIFNSIWGKDEPQILRYAITPNRSMGADVRHDIAPIADALAKVQALTGVTFTMAGSDVRQMGLIAQEVQAVAPEAVVKAEGVLRLAYGNLVGLLVEAIKDLAQEVDQLKRTAP